jgi:hypothetical protein
MAWIKLETHTFDKVEVFSMAQELGIDPDSVVGKCCRVWAWFDANTTDGITKSVTTALLDRYCGITGFSQAMVNVGWMVIDDGDLFLPNYDRHNSQTAKDRALNAKRVAKSKKKALDNAEGNGKGNGESLPKSLDREEKRREDSKAPKGTRFTLDSIPEEWILFCRKERSDLNPTVVFDGFKDYWVSVAGAKGVKADWFATWRNWIRNQKLSAVQQVEKVKFI